MSDRPIPSSLTMRSKQDSIVDKLWNDAITKYEGETGHKLVLADGFPSESRKPEEIIDYIVKQSDSLETSRRVGKGIRQMLKPVVNVVLLFLDAGAEAGSQVTPGGKTIFCAMGALLRATNGVSGLYDAIKVLLQRVADFFQHVSDLLDTPIPPTPALTTILVKTLVQLFITLGIVTKYCGSIASEPRSWFEKVIRVLFWRTKGYFAVIIGKTDVADALRSLGELTKKELLVITTQTYTMARDVQRKADIERLSSWLNPPNCLPNNYENKRRDGSCAWFFNDKFRKWKNQKDGMYWVSGTAGTGKSVLCSSVIDVLLEDTTLLLAYYYFDYSDTVKRDSGSTGLLASLVFQIGTAHDEGIAYLKSKHSRHSPKPRILLDLLSHLLRLSGRTFIVIDALDECPEPERIDRGLLGFLRDLRALQQSKDVDLRVFVASRPEPDLRDRMKKLATHLLADFQGVPEHAVEIACHIESQLFGEESQSLYLGWSDDIKREAQAVMIKKSNGMFLWVTIVLRYLRHCNPGDVLEVLNELPADLYKTYERILKNFPPSRSRVRRALRAFECIAFAKRPLYVDEVMAIFSANLKSPNETVIDSAVAQGTKSDVNAETFVLSNCPSLLDVVGSKDGGKVVQFIHFSAKEYLTSSELRRAASSARDYSVDESNAKLTLARLCIASINLDDLLSGFQPYAAQFFDDHTSSPIVDGLRSHSFRFPKSQSSEAFNSWARIHFQCGIQNVNYSPELIKDVIHARGTRRKTALHIAAQWGRAEASRSLLDHNAVVNDTDKDGTTPLHIAASFGHLQVVRILLESFPASNQSHISSVRDGQGQTALHTAARNGRAEVGRALLDHDGALVNDTDEDGDTALHLAANLGHLNIVYVLLDHFAADVFATGTSLCRARGQYGETALHRAVLGGHSDVARALLGHGALVSDTAENCDTALHYAAHCGHSDVACILLNHPAVDESDTAVLRCRIQGEQGWTALHQAARNGHTEIARVLLSHGALVDDIDESGNIPLYLAACWGHLDVLRVLLEHRAVDGSNTAVAQCGTRDNEGRTALHLAASEGYSEVCRVLLDHGALVDVTDNYGNTPLQHAEKAGYLVNMNFEDGCHPDVARVLLEYGATSPLK